jgi:hypothetical protein
MDISPGGAVTVEITKKPKPQAAEKTLERVCGKDPKVRKYRRLIKENRPSWREKRRGGRWWHHQMKSGSYVSLEPGSTYTVPATVDVIRDLQSVSDWINVTQK